MIADSTYFNLVTPYEKYYYICAQNNKGTPYTPKWRNLMIKQSPINWRKLIFITIATIFFEIALYIYSPHSIFYLPLSFYLFYLYYLCYFIIEFTFFILHHNILQQTCKRDLVFSETLSIL